MPSLVSVIIPAWNAAQWIQGTIECALAQTWKNKEVIVIDDASTDRTLAIAKSFGSERVKAVAQEKRGAAAARNLGLSLAEGNFIQWLDADDLLAPDKIARQMEAARAERSSLVLLSSVYGIFYSRLKKAKFMSNALWKDMSPVDWLITSMTETLWTNPGTWLVSRELTRKAGPWDERLTMDDDGEYFARVVANCQRIRFIPEARSFYRQSGFQQLSRKMTDQAIGSLILSSRLRIRTLLDLENSERTRRAALALLQARANLLYFCNQHALEQLRVMASELGGILKSPLLGWRIRVLQRLFGQQRGVQYMTSLRKWRMAATVKWDGWMSRLGI